jgi:hypothetical protein
MFELPRHLRAAALVALFMSAGACTTPTYITGASSSGDTIKFTYRKVRVFSLEPPEQGVIKCEVAEDGSLQKCRKLKILVDGEDYRGNP